MLLLIIAGSVTYNTQCANGAAHLVGGSTSSEGRYEICLGGTWTTLSLSPSSSDSQNAAVLCRQLGLPSLGKVPVSFVTILILSCVQVTNEMNYFSQVISAIQHCHKCFHSAIKSFHIYSSFQVMLFRFRIQIS